MMAYSNKDFINKGVPKSAFLPGTSYWKKKSTFTSSSAIWNWDNVTTNKRGSKITLNASKDFYGQLGNAMFRFGTITMSAKNDVIHIKCISQSPPAGDSSLQIGGGSTFEYPVPILNLGNGNNTVTAGLGRIAWNGGIELQNQSRLLSGSGKDVIKAAGIETGIGISVGGLISTGAGDDIIEGISNKTHGIMIGSSGRIDMGSTKDRLTGIGQVDDLSYGTIYSNGWIDMGDGDDEITGTSFMINGNPGRAQLSMGTGNDKLIATLHHSNAPIDFGDGIDRLYLPSGQYNISDLGGGFYSLLSTGENEGVYGADKISGLELIVSKTTGAEYALSSGTLTVA